MSKIDSSKARWARFLGIKALRTMVISDDRSVMVHQRIYFLYACIADTGAIQMVQVYLRVCVDKDLLGGLLIFFGGSARGMGLKSTRMYFISISGQNHLPECGFLIRMSS